MLKRSYWCALCVVVLVVAGCRQPDGQIPQPSTEEQNEIGDVSRDLLNVARGDAQATQELSDDLGNFTPFDAAIRLAPQMGVRLARALSGRTVTDQQARAISEQLFVVFKANTLSVRQITTVQDALRMHLAQIGTPERDIASVLDQVAAVQAAINESPKRWWQVR
jgi:hypothetical protein